MCTIFILLIKIKTKEKDFIWRFFVCRFVVRYIFYFAQYLTAILEWKPSKIEKKYFSFTLYEGDAEFSIKGGQILMGGR